MNFEAILDVAECYLNGSRCIAGLDWFSRSQPASEEIYDALYHVTVFLVRALIFENHHIPEETEDKRALLNHNCRSALLPTFTYFFDHIAEEIYWHCNDDDEALTIFTTKTNFAFHSLLQM